MRRLIMSRLIWINAVCKSLLLSSVAVKGYKLVLRNLNLQFWCSSKLQCLVHKGVIYLNYKTSQWNTYNHKYCDETKDQKPEHKKTKNKKDHDEPFLMHRKELMKGPFNFQGLLTFCIKQAVNFMFFFSVRLFSHLIRKLISCHHWICRRTCSFICLFGVCHRGLCSRYFLDTHFN